MMAGYIVPLAFTRTWYKKVRKHADPLRIAHEPNDRLLARTS